MKFGKPKIEEAAPAPSPDRLIGPKDLPEKGIHYCANHRRRLTAAGKFPRPVKLSARRLAWRESDIDRWIEQKIAESRAEAV